MKKYKQTIMAFIAIGVVASPTAYSRCINSGPNEVCAAAGETFYGSTTLCESGKQAQPSVSINGNAYRTTIGGCGQSANASFCRADYKSVQCVTTVSVTVMLVDENCDLYSDPNAGTTTITCQGEAPDPNSALCGG